MIITPSAILELGRQSSFAGFPGTMHIDLLEDSGSEGWRHIRLRPGRFNGIPIARVDGVTLYVPKEQFSTFHGLVLNYFGDISGGGFLISTPNDSESCSCGAGFRKIKR